MSSLNSTSRTQAWLESLRPKTLPLGLIAIVTGSALAYWMGHFELPIALLAILTAGTLQILSNLANDYGDAVKGTDTEERLGPLRGMQKGMITAAQMKKALILNVIISCICGIALIIVACKKPEDAIGFLVMGLLAIVAAITYTVGKRPYGYMGLGDISVAVLNINNMRDLESDIQAGKNTLAVRLGPAGSRTYHTCVIFLSIACLIIFTLLYMHRWTAWLFLLAIPMLLLHIKRVNADHSGEAMRPLLEHMVKAALLTNVLFSLGLVLE